MTMVVKASPVDAGCWVESSRGIYAGARMVELAIAHGWVLSDDDLSVFAWALAGRPAAGTADVEYTYPEAWDEIQDEVTDWLTDNVAPDGHVFEWIDGELMMWTHEQSCEASGDRCEDPEHHHTARTTR